MAKSSNNGLQKEENVSETQKVKVITLNSILDKYIKDHNLSQDFKNFLSKEYIGDFNVIIPDDMVKTYNGIFDALLEDYNNLNKYGKTAEEGKEKLVSGKMRKIMAIGVGVGLGLGALGINTLYNGLTKGVWDPINYHSTAVSHQEGNFTLNQNGTFHSTNITYAGTIASNNVDLSYDGNITGNLNAQLNADLDAILDATLDAQLDAKLDAQLNGTEVSGDVDLYIENGTISGVYNGTIHYANANVSENGTIELTNYTGWIKGKFNGTITGKVEGTVKGTVKGDVEGDVEGTVKGVVNGTVEGKEKGKISGQIHSTLNGVIDEIAMNGTMQGTARYTLEQEIDETFNMLPAYAALGLIAGFGTYGVLDSKDKAILNRYKDNLTKLEILLLYSKGILHQEKQKEIEEKIDTLDKTVRELYEATAQLDNSIRGNDGLYSLIDEKYKTLENKINDVMNEMNANLSAISTLLKIGEYKPHDIVQLIATSEKEIEELSEALNVDPQKLNAFYERMKEVNDIGKLPVEFIYENRDIITKLIAGYQAAQEWYGKINPELKKLLANIESKLYEGGNE